MKMEIKTKHEDYWYCERCKNDNVNSAEKDRPTEIPCPRIGCEAKVLGEIITSIKLHSD